MAAEQSPGDELKSKRRHWNWLLLAPLALLIYPGVYARATPSLLGFPFFYWYQFAAVMVTALLTGLVYFATRSRAEKSHNR